MLRHLARMGEERGVYRVSMGKPEGRRPLRRPRRRWADNIRMDLQEVGCVYMDWIGLAGDRDRRRTLVSVVMNLRVPWNAGIFLTSCRPVTFSRRTLHHGVSNIHFACLSRDGSRNAYKSAGKVQIKTVPIKMDEKFVVKSEEIPIRGCRVIHTFGETRRRINGQRDLTRPFLLGCEPFWKFTGLSSVPCVLYQHLTL